MNYYTAKQKARAMQILIQNMGNTRLTAEETGIPERTIARWRYEYSPTTVLMPNDSEDILERIVQGRYIQIRNDLLDQVQHVAKEMQEHPELLADLTITYARLLDRLIKIEQSISAHSFQLIILWEDPEGFVKLSQDIEF